MIDEDIIYQVYSVDDGRWYIVHYTTYAKVLSEAPERARRMLPETPGVKPAVPAAGSPSPIKASDWPTFAKAHVYDADGEGQWLMADREGVWYLTPSYLRQPDGWDWSQLITKE